MENLFLFDVRRSSGQGEQNHIPLKLNEISDSLSRLQLDRFKTLAPMADEVPYRCPPISRLMLHYNLQYHIYGKTCYQQGHIRLTMLDIVLILLVKYWHQC
jgi:hypothetical protein